MAKLETNRVLYLFTEEAVPRSELTQNVWIFGAMNSGTEATGPVLIIHESSIKSWTFYANLFEQADSILPWCLLQK